MSESAGALRLPIEPYEVTGYAFGQRVRSRKILWARHLGDDILAEPGTKVVCIGDGKVVWSEMRLGTNEKRNWGGVIIVEHTNSETNLAVSQGAQVAVGDHIGDVAPGSTPENGWWKLPHLHFGLYTGPWMQKVLPGYARPFEGRTKFSWWENPKSFIEAFNQVLLNTLS